MVRVEDYRAYAKKCFVWAQEAESEELRRASLEMASYWMEAAMRNARRTGSKFPNKPSGP